MNFDPTILNIVCAGFGVYLCYRVLRIGRKTGRRIKRRVNNWLDVTAVLLFIVIAVISYKMGGWHLNG